MPAKYTSQLPLEWTIAAAMTSRSLQRLLAAAEARGLDQAQLAARIGVTAAAITNWKARGGIPKAQREAAANAVGMTVEELMYGDPPKQGGLAQSNAVNTYSTRTIKVHGAVAVAENGQYERVEATGRAGAVEAISADPAAYALKILGGVPGTPLIEGWYLVVEPSREPVPGEFTLIELLDGSKRVESFLFRRPDLMAAESLCVAHTRHTYDPETVSACHPVGYLASPGKLRV